MSDMTVASFTVRDLNRQPARVLAACDRLGAVQIRSRGGKLYWLKAERQKGKPRLPDFSARRKAVGMKPLGKQAAALLDRLIAGE